MKVSKESQRLLFLGKQLEDEDDEGTKFTLFDYNVKVRHLIYIYFPLPCSKKLKICPPKPPKDYSVLPWFTFDR